MKYAMISLFAVSLAAQEAPPAAPLPQMPAAQSTAPAVSTMSFSDKSVIVIDPKTRAADYAQAFDFLRRDKPSLKINVLTSSAIFSNVTEISATKGGTLLFIKFLSNQGTKTHVIPVEEIREISYSPT